MLNFIRGLQLTLDHDKLTQNNWIKPTPHEGLVKTSGFSVMHNAPKFLPWKYSTKND